MIDFLDKEAFRLIDLYNAKSSVAQRKQAFDQRALRQLYAQVSQQISDIMSPHANAAWERSVFLLKQAARALKITPDWESLKEKTIRCAHQVAWETITPEAQRKTKMLAKARSIRATLITIVQKTKDQPNSLTLEEISELFRQQDVPSISVGELPIFGPSPMGLTLQQTVERLREEMHLPHNEGFVPAILIISDGMPTDTQVLDVASLAERIKQARIPLICCFVTNRNIGRPGS